MAIALRIPEIVRSLPLLSAIITRGSCLYQTLDSKDFFPDARRPSYTIFAD
ncbi:MULTISPECIES: hypothetical protein [Oscillatoriales]|uniref:Uncharacterized protein n=1 Tax=Aerosakkonema funiforme FACHB-1375 TaxID=2949571 RepID=A0A926ZJX9_9CYAN|nr:MULTISPECIES: hypothetical protein [Oscillatoriales]MBD2183471.1 hypothetical protein [Aerosakkonema funiforme FACHB-1375]